MLNSTPFLPPSLPPSTAKASNPWGNKPPTCYLKKATGWKGDGRHHFSGCMASNKSKSGTCSCPGFLPPRQKGLHAGSAFLIILSASFSIYCFAGIMLGQRAGRDGIASLPNLEFWKGLPGLVGTCTCNHARLARAFPLHLHLPLLLLHTGRRTHRQTGRHRHRHRHTHTHTHT